jgi:hypothetical protein
MFFEKGWIGLEKNIILHSVMKKLSIVNVTVCPENI